MRLCFLLEGKRTEPKLYRSWLQHVFPNLPEIHDPVSWQGDGFWLISGGGQPGIFDRIPEVVADIAACNAQVDHFFLCLDAEDEDPQVVRQKADAKLQRHARPGFQPVVIVQTCCIETWLLGDRALFRHHPRHSDLESFRAFFDVTTEDPETMDRPDGFETKAHFHGRYLKAAARDIGATYSKEVPGKYFCAESHFRELVQRTRDTSHLRSFGLLASSWQALGGMI